MYDRGRGPFPITILNTVERDTMNIEPKYTWRPSPWLVLCVFFLLLPYAFSFGGSGASFTLVNGTPSYLHAVINNESIVYIPPGMTITRETNYSYQVSAEVTYSPGQGRSGSARRTFQATVHTYSTGTTSESQTSDCSGSNGNTCSSESTSTGASETTTTVDPIVWVVTADTLSSN